MIILYYIEGIDRENIPYVYPKYKTRITISDYLREHEVATIPNSYYPPYYKNIISISSEDFIGNFLETSINYLGIVFGNKTYYYFIDSIEYVNEDLYKLHVTMDVIMTYINEIKIHGGIIERKFIDRWNDIYINRNYIRENCSKGLFQLTERKYLNERKYYDGDYNNDDSYGIFVLRFTESPYKPEESQYEPDRPIVVYKDGVDCFARYSTFIIPFIKTGFNNLMYFNNSKKYHTTLRYTLYDTCSEPTIVDCRYYPINLFDKYVRANAPDATTPNITVVCENPNYTVYSKDGAVGNQPVLYRCSTMDITPIKGDYIIPWTRTSAKLQKFNSQYVPALIDENYMRLSYGDGEVQATAQLYLLKLPNVTYNYKYDINGGARYYWFEGDVIVTKENEVLYGNNNMLSSLAVNENPCTFDLVSDSWKTWKAYNSATLPLTLGKTALDVAKFATGIGRIGSSIDSLTSIGGYLDKRYKVPTLNKAGQRKLFSLQGEYNDYLADGLFDATNIPSRYENIMNASAAPQTLKSGGVATSALFSEGMNIRMDIYKVNDFEQCAQYYHRYGYLVDEYINEVDNVFDYVSTRYYYNILKMRNADISLVNSPASTEIIELINERLENGIRLWNCDEHNTFVEIGNYTYDNVERSYLNE